MDEVLEAVGAEEQKTVERPSDEKLAERIEKLVAFVARASRDGGLHGREAEGQPRVRPFLSGGEGAEYYQKCKADATAAHAAALAAAPPPPPAPPPGAPPMYAPLAAAGAPMMPAPPPPGGGPMMSRRRRPARRRRRRWAGTARAAADGRLRRRLRRRRRRALARLHARAGDTAPVDEQRIDAILTQRNDAKRARDFETADRLRDQLQAEFNIRVDDKTREWRVMGAGGGMFGLAASHAPVSGGYGAAPGMGGGMHVGHDYIGAHAGRQRAGRRRQGEPDPRATPRRQARARLHDALDALRDQLRNEMGIEVMDREKQWCAAAAG